MGIAIELVKVPFAAFLDQWPVSLWCPVGCLRLSCYTYSKQRSQHKLLLVTFLAASCSRLTDSWQINAPSLCSSVHLMLSNLLYTPLIASQQNGAKTPVKSRVES